MGSEFILLLKRTLVQYPALSFLFIDQFASNKQANIKLK